MKRVAGKRPAAKRSAAKRPAGARPPAKRRPVAKRRAAAKGAAATRRRKTAGARSFPKAPKAKPVKLARKASKAGKTRKVHHGVHMVHGAPRPAAARQQRKPPAIRPPFEAYQGSKPYLFISYSHENMREVFNTIRKLNANRYRIWYDEGIEPGNEWPEEVGRAILNCSQFMVFMSPTAVNSRNVRNEINLATSDAKSILVIYLQETELSEGLRLQIGTVQNLNRYEMTEPEFLDKLKKVLSTELRS